MNGKIATVASVAFLLAGAAQAATITDAEIFDLSGNVVGSGNGTLDLRMFTFSGADIPNTGGAVNVDNANTQAAQGAGGDDNSFTESFVTTVGDLKAFYAANFGAEADNCVGLFLDLNETGGGSPTNTLGKLDIILNPTTIQGNPNPGGDVDSDTQNAINQVYTGGTLLSSLDSAKNLPVVEQGAGFADYAILTGIDLDAYADSDVLLFNVSMSNLSNGAEEIFISGEFDCEDATGIPEPTGALLFSCVAGVMALKRHRRPA